ncbi:MAG: Hpt domain-containing protein, partial [Rhodospirillaceae bacterium]|nr:Hpt domain-containing protein [Rhodospirillaceae bacterium]
MTTTSPDVAGPSALPGNILDRLRALRAEFSEALGGRVREARTLWTPIAQNPAAPAVAAGLKKIHEIVHALAGSGKSFGFPDVSIAAAPLDALLRLVLEDGDTLNAEEIAQAELLIQELEKAARLPGEPISFDDGRAGTVSDAERGAIHVMIAAAANDTKAIDLREAIMDFGYPCTITPDIGAVPQGLAQSGYAVVFADITRGNAHLSVLRSSSALARLPLVLTSAHAT